jgi:replicative DNA helicase
LPDSEGIIKYKNNDIAIETMIMGGMYKEPNLYIEYGVTIRSKYDFYYESVKFFYDCFELYYTTYSNEINEIKVNTFMLQDEERKSLYRKFGGWNTIKKAMDIVDISDYKNHYDVFKKYSLMREYEKKGFPVERLASHPKFYKLKAEQVTQWMRATVDKVQTVIGGGDLSVKLGKDMKKCVIQWRKVPAMGIELPWENWITLFRGWRKKKLIIDGMLSNEGKTRRLTFLLAYISLILKKKCLMMANEMDEEDVKAGMITAVCNNSIFGFNLNIPESNIVLGEYENEEQFQKVCEVAEYIEQNTTMFFKDMSSDYSDRNIENEIKKHVIGLGCECIFYDTLKGYQTDQWETVKQTATKLKDLCSELNVRGYATIQLTDDSLYIPVEKFSSNNIANAKQLKHVVDHMILEKRIEPNEYNTYNIVDEWGIEMTLEEYNKHDKNNIKWFYYGQKVDKNRGGGKGMVLCSQVNLDLNVWKEIGIITKDISNNKNNNKRYYNKRN